MRLDPKLVSSSYAGPVTRQGVTVRLEIYCLDDDLQWVLEVVNENGTSTVPHGHFRPHTCQSALPHCRPPTFLWPPIYHVSSAQPLSARPA